MSAIGFGTRMFSGITAVIFIIVMFLKYVNHDNGLLYVRQNEKDRIVRHYEQKQTRRAL